MANFGWGFRHRKAAVMRILQVFVVELDNIAARLVLRVFEDLRHV